MRCPIPALALASDHAEIHLAFPTPPTLAVIQPGVQVVVDHDEEVFYANQQYWVRLDGDWYHAGHHGDAFTYVERHHVPSALMHLAPGHYRHYHPGASHAHGGDSHGDNGYGHGYENGGSSCGHGGGGHGHGGH